MPKSISRHFREQQSEIETLRKELHRVTTARQRPVGSSGVSSSGALRVTSIARDSLGGATKRGSITTRPGRLTTIEDTATRTEAALAQDRRAAAGVKGSPAAQAGREALSRAYPFGRNSLPKRDFTSVNTIVFPQKLIGQEPLDPPDASDPFANETDDFYQHAGRMFSSVRAAPNNNVPTRLLPYVTPTQSHRSLDVTLFRCDAFRVNLIADLDVKGRSFFRANTEFDTFARFFHNVRVDKIFTVGRDEQDHENGELRSFAPALFYDSVNFHGSVDVGEDAQPQTLNAWGHLRARDFFRAYQTARVDGQLQARGNFRSYEESRFDGEIRFGTFTTYEVGDPGSRIRIFTVYKPDPEDYVDGEHILELRQRLTAYNRPALRSRATYNNPVTGQSANVHIDSFGNLHRVSSSEALKTDVQPVSLEWAQRLLALQPKRFRSSLLNERRDWTTYGFMAEQAAAVDPRLASWGFAEEVTEEQRELYEENPESIPESALRPVGVQHEKILALAVAMLQNQEARLLKLEGF